MTRECLPQSSSSDKVLDNQISKLSSNTHSNQCFVLIALPVNQPPEVTLLHEYSCQLLKKHILYFTPSVAFHRSLSFTFTRVVSFCVVNCDAPALFSCLPSSMAVLTLFPVLAIRWWTLQRAPHSRQREELARGDTKLIPAADMKVVLAAEEQKPSCKFNSILVPVDGFNDWIVLTSPTLSYNYTRRRRTAFWVLLWTARIAKWSR